METRLRRRTGTILLWLTALTVFAADQATKLWVQRTFRLYEARSLGDSFPWNQVGILRTYNTGAAFGILADYGTFFAVVAVVVILGILVYYRRLPPQQWWLFLSFGLQLGGAMGNLADRLRLGHVVDLIRVGSFPIFNVADTAIVSGVLILAWHLWREERHEQTSGAEEESVGARFPGNVPDGALSTPDQRMMLEE